MIVLDAFSDHRPDNRFAQSLQDVPLRHLGSLMAAQDDGLLRLAMRGQPLRRSISAIRAQAAPGAVPRMSIGYRLPDGVGRNADHLLRRGVGAGNSSGVS